jgi:AcrR family transcriptional regulator
VRRLVHKADLLPKKRPTQARSQATFDALVDACTWLLPRRGYAGTTTNRIAERAGVGIASLYEYFPGKDAIVAQVAERLVDRVLARLGDGAEHVLAAGEGDAVRAWIVWIHETGAREKALVAVFRDQVPYTDQLEPVQATSAKLVQFSQQVRWRAGGFVRRELSDASLQLLINLVTSTILQIVLDRPEGVTRRELLEELIRRVEEWIR